MRFALLGTCASLMFSIIAYAIMGSFSPISTYASWDQFLRPVIIATMIQFVVLPVILVFLVNDAGELENFTKEGLLEFAWLVNTVGVIVMIVAGAMLGYAFSLAFVGWSPPPDPAAAFANSLKFMTWSMFIQNLGFAVPVFYFSFSKLLARKGIPFKPVEKIADILGMAFSALLPVASGLLAASPIYMTLQASAFGIIAMGIGCAWAVLYFFSLRGRELPDIPED